MKRRRKVLGGIAIILGFFIALLFLEIALRFFPVSDYPPVLPTNQKNPVFRFEPDRTLTYSKGYLFSILNVYKTNNLGFVSNYDYHQDSKVPLIAVIGDSFIEAQMIPFDETGHARIAKKLAGKARVYSFACSGVQLAGYLEYSDWIKNNFNPGKIIVVVVRNDFDKSLLEYSRKKGGSHFKEDSNGNLKMVRVDYSPGLRIIFKKSKLFCYIWINCQIRVLRLKIKALFSGKDSETGFVGFVPVDAKSSRVINSKKAVDLFMDKLPEKSGLTPDDILFVIDGFRPLPYSGEDLKKFKVSYFGIMRDYFISEARSGKYNVIDMNDIFIKDYNKNKKKFEFETDRHWNSRGHEMFYKAVYDSDFLNEYK